MKPITINYKHHNFILHTRDESDVYFSNHLINGEIWEPPLTDIWYDHINTGDLVLDVGANLGWYTKIANLKGAKSIAFEPHIGNYEILSRNCFDTNELYNICAGNSTQDVMLQLSNTNFGDNRTSPTGDIVCKQNTIDNIVGDRASQIRAIKIDTQGWEPNIIAGAVNTLNNVPNDCLIIIEYWPYSLHLNGFSSDAYNQLFEIFKSAPRYFPHNINWEEVKLNEYIHCDLVLYKSPLEQLITFEYQSLLNRNPDIEGLTNYMNSGLSIAQIRNDIINSREYNNIND